LGSQNRLNVTGARRSRIQVGEATARKIEAYRRPIFHYSWPKIEADIPPGKKDYKFPCFFSFSCLEEFAVALELCWLAIYL
jgi:hypothetical protein